VYDDLQPPKLPGFLEEEPLLPLAPTSKATVRLAYRPHDLAEVRYEVRVSALDVQPPLLGDTDPAAVGIERGREHAAIVRPRAADAQLSGMSTLQVDEPILTAATSCSW
jgi:hypothetical protein